MTKALKQAEATAEGVNNLMRLFKWWLEWDKTSTEPDTNLVSIPERPSRKVTQAWVDLLDDAEKALRTALTQATASEQGEPVALTEDQVWRSEQIMEWNAEHGLRMPTLMAFVRAVETTRALYTAQPAPAARPMPAIHDEIQAARTADADADEWPDAWAFKRGWQCAEAHHRIGSQPTAPAVPVFTDPQIDAIGLSDTDSGHQIYSFRRGFKRGLEMLSCAPAVTADFNAGVTAALKEIEHWQAVEKRSGSGSVWSQYVHGAVKNLLSAAPAAPAVPAEQCPTIDLDLLAWEKIKETAAASPWIPPEYYQSEWVAAVCSFLKEAAPAAAVPAVPEGMKLVPVAITEEMHQAAVKTIVRCTGNDDFPPRVWAAMLASAPTSTKGGAA